MNNKKDIILLGSTGSIGDSSLRLIRKNKEKFNLVGVSSHNNVKSLSEIVNEFNVPNVVLSNPKNAKNYFGKNKLCVGASCLVDLAKVNCDIVISGITGMSGLHPAFAAISVGNDLAIANKDTQGRPTQYFVEFGLSVSSLANVLFFWGGEGCYRKKILPQ